MDRIGRDCRDRTDDIHLHPRATTTMPPLAFRVSWQIEPSVWQGRVAATHRWVRTLRPPLGRTNVETTVRLTAPPYPCPPGGDAAPPHLAQGSRSPEGVTLCSHEDRSRADTIQAACFNKRGPSPADV